MAPPTNYLDFERPIAELDAQIEELKSAANESASEGSGEDSGEDKAAAKELSALEKKAQQQIKSIYNKIGPWEKTLVARHAQRPHFTEYCDALISDYTPLAGDRKFGDDAALLGGLGKLDGMSVMVIGHEKGKDTQGRLKHNFGMAQPEGYRKAVRLMDMAERFDIPVVSFVDTAGAYPGRGAEERGQAEAIARSIDRGLSLRVPFVTVITGEGGSGGAVAIATADKVMMLEHSIYSVISPEGCASILWRDAGKAEDAAKAMKITAQDLEKLGVIDKVIKEPVGGAHRAPEDMIAQVGKEISQSLKTLSKKKPEALIRARRDKFLNIGRSLA